MVSLYVNPLPMFGLHPWYRPEIELEAAVLGNFDLLRRFIMQFFLTS